MKEDEFLMQKCYHCGNEGLMKKQHCYTYSLGEPVYDDFNRIIDRNLEESYSIYMLSCFVCKNITIKQLYTNDLYLDPYERQFIHDIKILYPINTIDYTGVPPQIKSAFEATLKVKNLDIDICLLSARRVLEAICIDQGIKGKTLDSMIKDLFNQKNCQRCILMLAGLSDNLEIRLPMLMRR